MKKLLKSVSLLFFAVLAFASCSSSESEFEVQSDRGLAIQSINLNEKSVSLYGNRGLDSFTLTASYSPSFAQDTYIKWTSSDEKIVSVENTNGTSCKVTLQGAGKALVTATTYSGKVSASCTFETELSKTVPFAPSSMSLTPYSNSIEVEWTNADANADALEGIIVLVREGSDKSGKPVKEVLLEGSGSGQTCSGRILDLKSETDYYLEAYSKTVNKIVSEDSIYATTTTKVFDETPPDAVTNLEITEITSSSAKVSWTASTSDDLQLYKVYAFDEEENQLDYQEVSSEETSVTLTGFDAESIFFKVKVYAVDQNFNTSEAVVLDFKNLAHAENLSVSHDTSYSGILNITWKAPESEFDHVKVILETEGKDSIVIDNIAKESESLSVKDLIPNALYKVSVVLVDSEGSDLGSVSSSARASRIEIRFYSKKTTGYMVATSDKKLKTQSGNSAAYKYKWLKMPSLDSSVSYSFAGAYSETASTYSLMAQNVDSSPSDLYLYMTESNASNTSGSEASVTIAAKETISEAEKNSFATFFNAKANVSGYYALRFTTDFFQLGAKDNKIIYRYSNGSPGYDDWMWTVTEEDSTTKD